MTRAQGIAGQIQRWLSEGKSAGKCEYHSGECCVYDMQGQLIELHLCGLHLTRVPSAVWQCSSLQRLKLYDNQLCTLPAALGRLTALQELDLGCNPLSTLPAVVCRLTALRELRLCSNQLSILPAELGRLTALQKLDLRHNQLSILPAELGRLIALQKLDLHDNQLSTLPAELGQLIALQKLDLGSNRLCTLPAEICQLTTLQELDLSSNRLRILPAEICQLTALQKLDLWNNQLRTLPAELGRLTALQKLELSDNRLRTLPVEMCRLTALQELYLWGNQLRTLPVEMCQLTALQELLLNKNPLQPPLPELIEQGIPALLAYLRTLRPIKIFYCYAHEDENLRDHIDKHLGVLKRLGHIIGWYDRDILAGTEWEREIEGNLGTAHIILLLVSEHFINSDYCYGKEMQKAMEMHEQGKAHVIPILLRPVVWQSAPFAKLQVIPTDAKPITEWSKKDKALVDVAKQIGRVVNTLRTPPELTAYHMRKMHSGGTSKDNVNK